MLVLPGPGAAAIAGGAALISKGQRNYTGRVATPLEEKLDDVAEKAAVAVKDSAKKTAYKTAESAPKVAKKLFMKFLKLQVRFLKQQNLLLLTRRQKQ